MPSISPVKLHTRPFLVRTMLASGQFAHATAGEIDAALGSLYDRKRRLQHVADGGAKLDSDLELAVPTPVYKLHRTGVIPQLFDAHAIKTVSLRVGVLCCLCYHIGGGCQDWNYAPGHFLQYICPTRLRVDLPPESPYARRGWWFAVDPICVICQESVRRRLKKLDELKEPKDSLVWAETLAWFFAHPQFRNRIKSNAHNAARLRFDPRRPSTLRAAA